MKLYIEIKLALLLKLLVQSFIIFTAKIDGVETNRLSVTRCINRFAS